MPPNRISLKPSSVACALGIAASLLLLASAGTQTASSLTGHEHVFGFVQLFSLGSEQNLPSFFSTLLLVFAALLLWIITILKRMGNAQQVRYWVLLSTGFLLMAADEACSIHELFGRPTRMLLGDGHLGVFYFSWVVPGIALVLVLALIFVRFVVRLPSRTRLAFLAAAAIYIGGAIGCELVGGYIAESHGTGVLYNVEVTVEESLEMTGSIVFIWALLAYIADNFAEVRFSLGPVSGEVGAR